MRTNKIKFPEYFSPQVQNVIGPDGGSGCLLWHFWLLPIRQSARICWYARYDTCCSNCIGRRSFRLPADFLPCSQRLQPWLLLRSCKRPSFSGPTLLCCCHISISNVCCRHGGCPRPPSALCYTAGRRRLFSSDGGSCCRLNGNCPCVVYETPGTFIFLQCA